MATARSFQARSNRKLRSFKRNLDPEFEEVKLDYTKDVSENLKLVLREIVCKKSKYKEVKLNYLNAFVKICREYKSLKNSEFTNEEIICCLRICLVHEAKEVRIAGIRAIRYYLCDDETVDAFVTLHVDFLLCRCIDIVLDNQSERVHALKLVRKILNVSPNKISFALVRCIVSLANDEPSDHEKLINSCLCIISELALVNISICAECDGLNTLIRKTIDIQQPWINEAMIGVILFLLNSPKSRVLVKKYIRVEQIIAPFTDLHYRHTVESSEITSSNDRQACQQASKHALLSIFRSWSGLIWLGQLHTYSGLRSIINALYLEYSEIHDTIMQMMFDLFRIPVPKWTSDFNSAVLSIDPSTPKDSWDLYEGFVAEEGKDILSNQSKFRLNIIDNYLALLLLAFVNAGVLDAIVEVITRCNNQHITVRTTVLLAELLNLTSLLLPSECSQHCQALPKLLSLATSMDIPKEQRNQASVTVSNLTMIHKLKKRAPVPSSLFLDQQIRFCSVSSQRLNNNSIVDEKLESYVRLSDDLLNQSIKDSCVLMTNDCTDWDWNLISNCILKLPTECFHKLEDVNHKLFVRRIINFYKPSKRLFSNLLLTKENSLLYSSAAINLIEFLLEADDGECGRIHDEWMKDVAESLVEAKQSSLSSDAIFSPHKLMRTLAQHYFLFFGRLSSSSKGCKVLERSGIFQILLELIDSSNHGCYIKLISSSLDYTSPTLSRILLNKIIASPSEESRLYGTNILLVLLRAKLPEFHKWAIEILVTELYDKSPLVSSKALAILDEACNDMVNLEAAISIRPSLLHLGDDGLLLLIRFLSVPSGFKFLYDANFVSNELQKWETGFLLRYVDIIESKLNQALTRHQKDEHGVYGRHHSEKHYIGEVFLPCHLYGQLAQHEDGFNLLIQHTNGLHNVFQTVQQMRVEDEDQINQLKAALWALGHVGTSVNGITFLNHQEVIPDIIRLAEECPIFSVRGTCFYVIGLLSSTSIGSDLLSQVGWQSKRQHRLERWPVINPHHFVDENLSEEYIRHYSSSSNESRADENPEIFVKPSFNDRRTLSNCEQIRTRSTSSGGQSDCLPRVYSRPTCSVSLVENILPKNHLSLTSCKILHVRQSSASVLLDDREGSDVRDTKERSQSLTENKGSKKSNSMFKGDSDTKLNRPKEWLDCKIRSNSYADSTTSGISSCESIESRQKDAELAAPAIENNYAYVSSVRRRVRLRNTPNSVRHLSANPICNLTVGDAASMKSSVSLDNSIFNFASSKDAAGYETLRSLQRSPVGDMPGLLSQFAAACSNTSQTSLQKKLHGLSQSTKMSRSSTSSSTGTTEASLRSKFKRYMGVCLPIDPLMIFSIHDDDLDMPDIYELNTEDENEDVESVRVNDGLTYHSHQTCIACHKYIKVDTSDVLIGSKMVLASDDLIKERSDSIEHKPSPILGTSSAMSGTPLTSLTGSCTSASSVDLASSLTSSNMAKTATIRREIIRIVMNLSSSVAVKSSEQSLLNMKQKYSTIFQDICLYSEICHLLASYRFRYSARKFVQECFQDLRFDVLITDAERIIDIK